MKRQRRKKKRNLPPPGTGETKMADVCKHRRMGHFIWDIHWKMNGFKLNVQFRRIWKSICKSWVTKCSSSMQPEWLFTYALFRTTEKRWILKRSISIRAIANIQHITYNITMIQGHRHNMIHHIQKKWKENQMCESHLNHIVNDTYH